MNVGFLKFKVHYSHNPSGIDTQTNHTHTHTLGETKVPCLDEDIGSGLWGELTGTVDDAMRSVGNVNWGGGATHPAVASTSNHERGHAMCLHLAEPNSSSADQPGGYLTPS